MSSKIASTILMTAGLFLAALVLLANAEAASGATTGTGASVSNIRVVKGVGAEKSVTFADVEEPITEEGEMDLGTVHDDEIDEEEEDEEEDVDDEDMETAEREAGVEDEEDDEEGEEEEEEEEGEADNIGRMTEDSAEEKSDMDSPAVAGAESVRTQAGKGAQNSQM